jgi:uncharacterized protein YbjT (DUF2867 family)
MPERNPILITGAAGEIGGVSRTMVDMLLEQGHPVRAFVRQDDERAHSLRQAGAEVFVGDLLTIADVTAALKGVRRIYFSMSLSPYYTDAVSLMAAAARAQGDIEVFVNISEYEQSFMTFDHMTAPEEERRARLGGLVANWSPQQRAHWVAEQVLEWSGVPTVNIQAAFFVENPIMTWLALGSLADGELRLPFGDHRLAPIAGYDVAELLCTNRCPQGRARDAITNRSHHEPVRRCNRVTGAGPWMSQPVRRSARLVPGLVGGTVRSGTARRHHTGGRCGGGQEYGGCAERVFGRGAGAAGRVEVDTADESDAKGSAELLDGVK